MNIDVLPRHIVSLVVFVLCLFPYGAMLWQTFTHQLGANPIEEITHVTGVWALRFLLVTLALSPLRHITGKAWLLRYRRMLGLFAFFYALNHFAAYLVLDQFFAWREIAGDILKRPYITVGFVAFVLLVPLAITSTRAMVRRLGARRWLILHKLVYISAAGAVLHYLWLVKADTRDPLVYGIVLLILLGYRAWRQRRYAIKTT